MDTPLALRLAAAVRTLSQARELEPHFIALAQTARALSQADSTTVMLCADGVCHAVAEDAIEPLWRGKHFSLDASPGGWAMHEPKPVSVEDVYTDARSSIAAYRHTFVKSLVLVPLRQSTPIGVIACGWAKPHAATVVEIEALQAVADVAAAAIENLHRNRAAEQRIRDQATQLEAAARDLDGFAYSVSHDLRAPLRHMAGFSELLAAPGGCTGPALGYVERIRTAATRMNAQIDDLLKLSRISTRELRRQQVDISRLAGEIATALEHSAPERKVGFEIAPALTVFGDAALLRLALEHLFENAWKFTASNAQAHIVFGNDGGTFYVRDNGIGFDAASAERLFQPFARFHAEHEFPGNGIGLALVRRIILRHGGTIRAQSSPHQGATFHFTLA